MILGLVFYHLEAFLVSPNIVENNKGGSMKIIWNVGVLRVVESIEQDERKWSLKAM